MRKTPVNIITGFLGAGKTTAIIKLLKQKKEDEKWAIIINEFGKVSIDYLTLSPKTGSSENVFEISGGCICCSAQAYFQENIDKIVEQGVYDRIIIEPSGLGGIEMVSERVKTTPTLQLMPVICLLGITNIDNPRIQINPIFQSQIMSSEIVALSKCDLVDEIKQNKVLETLTQKYSGKLDYLKVFKGELDVNVLDMEKPIRESTTPFQKLFFSNKELTDINYHKESLTYHQNTIFDISELIQYFEQNKEIIRAKGYIKIKGGWRIFNYTLGEHFIETCSDQPQSNLTIIVEKENMKEIYCLKHEIKKLTQSLP